MSCVICRCTVLVKENHLGEKLLPRQSEQNTKFVHSTADVESKSKQAKVIPYCRQSHLLATLLARKNCRRVGLAACCAVGGWAPDGAVSALRTRFLLSARNCAACFRHLVRTSVNASVAVQRLAGTEHLAGCGEGERKQHTHTKINPKQSQENIGTAGSRTLNAYDNRTSVHV